MLLTAALSDRTDSYVQFMTVLLLFVFVLAITALVTRWIGGYQKSRSVGANMELIESLRLSNNKYVQIVRIGRKYLAVAVCKDTVTMLSEIPEEDLSFPEGSLGSASTFRDVLAKYRKKESWKKKTGETNEEIFFRISFGKLICLLMVAGILYLSWGQNAYAVEDNRPEAVTESVVTDTPYRDSNLTGTENERTNVDPPGASESAEDLAELNIANTVTVTYNNGNGSVNGTLRILMILTLIAIAPSLIIMLTSFTRIIIVLHFTRQALNTQTAPPNTVLIGIALFLTFYVMQPTIAAVYTDAIVPFEAGELTQEEALTAAAAPIRQFMYGQTQMSDVNFFMDLSRTEWSGELDDIPISVLVPAFIINELRQAFIIGFLIYIPFIVIDMVVASTLMSMGMMMLPPTTISMPFKILLFVLADGWYLVIKGVVETFYY